MKTRVNSIIIETAFVSFIVIAVALPLRAAPAAPVTSGEPLQSVFVQPSNPKEGCDPFFPKSTRPYVVVSKGGPADISSLVVRGISKVNGKTFVIINNHTFGVGDYGSVLTPQGSLYIHCVEIGENNVIVEANGQRQSLPFSSTP